MLLPPAPAEPESITEKLNGYYKNHDSRLGGDVKVAAYQLLGDEGW